MSNKKSSENKFKKLSYTLKVNLLRRKNIKKNQDKIIPPPEEGKVNIPTSISNLVPEIQL